MLRKEVGDLLVKLQNAEQASKDGVAKLKEERSKLKAQLAEKDAVNATRCRIIADLQKAAKDSKKRSSEQANELKMLHKKALADKDTELSKLKAQLAEKDADNAIQYTIIADLEKAAKDREKRSSEQANELKMSHKKSPADKDTGLSKLKAQLGQAQAQVQQPQMQTTTNAGDFLRYTTVCM